MRSQTYAVVIAVACFAVSIISSAAATGEPTRVISVDLQNAKGPLNTMFKLCVGAGRANEGLRADWQRQLAYAHRECGFQYVRMHGLFCDDMGVLRMNHGKPEYNWQYIDEVYDFLQSIGMKPFVELSFMPNQLASGSKTIFWWRGNVTPPRDLNQWADFMHAFAEHVRERYGDAEVRTWYFEVWNEPNLDGFWAGTQQQYFDFYSATAHAIKSVSADYKVGGPATAGCAWVPEFIHYCDTNHVPLDFVSTHTYAVNGGFLDEHGHAATVLSPDPMSISGDVRRVQQEISESPLPKLELHLTEWSTSYTPSDPIHDSYQSASFILDRLKKCGDAAKSMSYWTFTDIFEEAGPRWEAFHGGFGLTNYQDINKPAFYAFQFLNRLGLTELKDQDACSWVCTGKLGGLQALIWDYSYTQDGKTETDQDYYKRDLPSKPKCEIKLNASNLPAGRYLLTIYKIGYRANDAYSTYRDLGSPAQLTKEQVARIKKENNGAPSDVGTVTIGPGEKFTRELSLRENDVVLLTLTPRN